MWKIHEVMLIHQEKRIGFVLHPRTASHSTATALKEIGFVSSGHHHYIDSEWVNIAKSVACTVRNPYDVLVSWYHVQGGHRTFEQFSRDWPNLWALNGMFYGLKFCDHVLNYENLDFELNEWLKEYELGPVVLPREHVTKNRVPWERMFTDHEVSIKICDPRPRSGRFHL